MNLIPTVTLIQTVRRLSFFEGLNSAEDQKKLEAARAELKKRGDKRWKMGY